MHAVGVEGGEHGGDRRRAVAGAGVQRPAVERGVADSADAGERQPGGGVLGIDELDLDPVALELGLELVGRARTTIRPRSTIASWEASRSASSR